MVSSPCTFLKVIHIFHRVIEILCLRRMRSETNIDNLRALGMLSGGNEYVTEFQFSICHVCLVTMSQVSRVSVTIFHRLWRVGRSILRSDGDTDGHHQQIILILKILTL